VTLEKYRRVFQKRFAEVVRCVVIVMQVDFNLAISLPAQIGEPFDVLWLVLVDRKEERVPRRSAVTVTQAIEQLGITQRPVLHALLGDVWLRLMPLRLEMISDAEQQMHGLVRCG
jgi:hypothetical protein